MPIFQLTNLNQNTVLAVWKITESRDLLFAQLSDRISDAGKNRHDNIHWLASRCLLQELYPDSSIELIKDAFNKPSLLINRKPYSVSITHSFDFAAVMVSSTQNVALDLEKVDERVARVAHKFIRPDERFGALDLKAGRSDAATLYYTIIWSAKETLYKYYGKKELDFLANLRIQPFLFHPDGLMIEGCITKNNYALNLPIAVRVFETYVLTYSAGE
jgi:4'-phosphopantetheinyl transferase